MYLDFLHDVLRFAKHYRSDLHTHTNEIHITWYILLNPRSESAYCYQPGCSHNMAMERQLVLPLFLKLK